MPSKKSKVGTKPTKNNKTVVSKTTKSTEDQALMDFEQFVSSRPNNRRSKTWLALTLIIIIFILAALWLFMSKIETLEKSDKFKAVYLENGQVYYAKVLKEDALNIYLDDVYYIQVEQQSIPAEEEDGEPRIIEVPVLVKRGDELHKPEGLMQINRAKLVAIEEIGNDSEIITEINRINQTQ